MKRWLTLPFTDVLYGLDRCMAGGWKALVLVTVGLIAGWWIYVPIHELLHAAACLITGGEVSTLEIDPIYFGGLLAAVIPFVEAGGDYAGRLSGFDTHGNDFIYLATVLGPYLLTLLPGVWWLRRAAQARRGFLFGFSLPIALAPLVSATGDAYEIGSILTTLWGPWSGEGSRQLLRGDDLFLKVGELAEQGSAGPWIAAALAAMLGLLWALGSYWLGGKIAHRLGEPRLQDPRTSP